MHAGKQIEVNQLWKNGGKFTRKALDELFVKITKDLPQGYQTLREGPSLVIFISDTTGVKIQRSNERHSLRIAHISPEIEISTRRFLAEILKSHGLEIRRLK